MSGVAYPSAPGGPRPEGHGRPALEEELFSGLVVSNPPHTARLFGLPASMAAHAAVLALILLLPLYWPQPLPDTGDPLRVLLYNPPAAAAAPLPKGSALLPRVERPKPVTPETKPRKPTLELPTTPREPEPLTPEARVPETEQFGSATGSDMGIPEGMDGGVEGGVAGGVFGGVVGGCVGCDGNGPVLDYDQAPVRTRLVQPVYPQDAFVKKIEGVVEVEFVIDATGRVPWARVVRSIPALDHAALDAVRQWQFRPALKHGRAVATLARAPVDFHIY